MNQMSQIKKNQNQTCESIPTSNIMVKNERDQKGEPEILVAAKGKTMNARPVSGSNTFLTSCSVSWAK